MTELKNCTDIKKKVIFLVFTYILELRDEKTYECVDLWKQLAYIIKLIRHDIDQSSYNSSFIVIKSIIVILSIASITSIKTIEKGS